MRTSHTSFQKPIIGEVRQLQAQGAEQLFCQKNQSHILFSGWSPEQWLTGTMRLKVSRFDGARWFCFISANSAASTAAGRACLTLLLSLEMHFSACFVVHHPWFFEPYFLFTFIVMNFIAVKKKEDYQSSPSQLESTIKLNNFKLHNFDRTITQTEFFLYIIYLK